MVRGDQWECGWCGDYGRLSLPDEAAPAPAPLDDFARAVNTLREGMPDLPPEEAHRTAWSLAAYGSPRPCVRPQPAAGRTCAGSRPSAGTRPAAQLRKS